MKNLNAKLQEELFAVDEGCPDFFFFFFLASGGQNGIMVGQIQTPTEMALMRKGTRIQQRV